MRGHSPHHRHYCTDHDPGDCNPEVVLGERQIRSRSEPEQHEKRSERLDTAGQPDRFMSDILPPRSPAPGVPERDRHDVRVPRLRHGRLAPHELSRWSFGRGTVGVMLRQHITPMPSVVMPMSYGQNDVDPALTSQEGRPLAAALIGAVDMSVASSRVVYGSR